jgi:hypothetical protein
MPFAPEDYRLNAKACLRMANTTPQGINKAWFEQIAEQWLRMATEEQVVRPSSELRASERSTASRLLHSCGGQKTMTAEVAEASI